MLCLLALLVGTILGWLGGPTLDLTSILGAIVFVAGGLAVGFGAVLFESTDTEVDARHSGQ